MKSKTVAALAVFAALLITAVAGVALTPATAAAAPGVTTLAGSPGVVGTVDATGTAARFLYPRGVAVDASGNVYVADTNASVIRKITAAGVVTTLAGTPGSIGVTDGTGAAARFNYPEGIGVDAAGNVLVADTQNNMIRKITPAGAVTTVAGQLGVGGFGGYVDGSTAVAMFKHSRGIVLDAAGNIYVGDSGNNAVRKITPAGVVSTLAGGLGVFNNPRGVAVDAAGYVYVADFNNHRIARVSPAGVVINWAGSGVQGAADGAGALAQFNNPDGLARTSAGILYVGDSGNNTIRQITTAGVVSTFAGGPPPTAAGSTDGINTAARFNDPRGVAVDTAGNVYIADRGNSTIRKTVATVITITATAGANGSITPGGPIGVSSGTNSTTFTITPNAGYAVADVLVDGVSVGAVLSYTFTNVTANHTISATFAANAPTSITVPTITGTYTAGTDLTVPWTTNPAAFSGEFGVFADSGSGWYIGKLVPNNGTDTYSTSVTLNVPIGTTYTIVVLYRPTVGSGAWTVAGRSGGTFTVASTSISSITVPTITGTYTAGTDLTVPWTTNPAAFSGEFGVFADSGSGWYIGKLVPNNGTDTYSTSVTLNVPTGTTYTIVVLYRPTVGSGAWTLAGRSVGTFTVASTSISSITVSAITGTYTLGTDLTVPWMTDMPVSAGEFGVWADSGSGWYIGKLVLNNGTDTYSTIVTLNVPTPATYTIVVLYRPTVGSGAWTLAGRSVGTFTVN